MFSILLSILFYQDLSVCNLQNFFDRFRLTLSRGNERFSNDYILDVDFLSIFGARGIL